MGLKIQLPMWSVPQEKTSPPRSIGPLFLKKARVQVDREQSP
jgi:hypothetical protein